MFSRNFASVAVSSHWIRKVSRNRKTTKSHVGAKTSPTGGTKQPFRCLEVSVWQKFVFNKNLILVGGNMLPLLSHTRWFSYLAAPTPGKVAIPYGSSGAGPGKCSFLEESYRKYDLPVQCWKLCGVRWNTCLTPCIIQCLRHGPEFFGCPHCLKRSKS